MNFSLLVGATYLHVVENAAGEEVNAIESSMRVLHIQENHSESEVEATGNPTVVPITSSGELGDSSGNLLECPYCFEKFPRDQLASLCCHDYADESMSCCKGCAIEHFTVKIKNEVGKIRELLEL